MGDRQQQYRGKKENLPTLLPGELGFCTDAKELYIGSETGNVLIASESLFTELEGATAALAGKLTANQAETVSAIDETAELTTAVSTINSLINSLKAAGIME